MTKKLLLLSTVQILLSSACLPFAPSFDSKELNKLSHEIGSSFSKGLTDGMKESLSVKAINDALQDPKRCQEIEKLGQNTVNLALQSIKGANKGAMEVFSEIINNTAKQIQEDTKEDSEAFKAVKSSMNLVTGNIKSEFINKLLLVPSMQFGTIFISCTGLYVSAMYGIPMGFRMLERALMKPKLIIASSKKSLFEKIFGRQQPEQPMIFDQKTEQRLNDITEITKTIHKKINDGNKNIKYRNLMLYGPPGTGKTLFATELAKRSGLEYAFMSGSSFSKFKDGEGIEALDELFAWAKKSKGLVIFIDEAETFLLKRENMDPQSKAYLLLNNFLNYTGTRSDKFMLVFATNHKESLDSAMYRRIDDLVEIPLPGKEERIRILNLYKDKILLNTEYNDLEFINSAEKVLTADMIEKIAQKTIGLSGSDLEGIINNIKTNTDILDPAIVSDKLVDDVTQQVIDKHYAFTNGIPLGTVIN